MTYRTPGGTLTEFAGRLPSMDNLASRFYTSPAPDRASVIDEARAFAESMRSNATATQQAAADYYLKVMDKTVASADYLERESTRLANILAKHAAGTSQLAGKKVDEVKRRANILLAFTKAGAKAKLQEAKEASANKAAEAANAVKGQAEKVRDEL